MRVLHLTNMVRLVQELRTRSTSRECPPGALQLCLLRMLCALLLTVGVCHRGLTPSTVYYYQARQGTVVAAQWLSQCMSLHACTAATFVPACMQVHASVHMPLR